MQQNRLRVTENEPIVHYRKKKRVVSHLIDDIEDFRSDGLSEVSPVLGADWG